MSNLLGQITEFGQTGLLIGLAVWSLFVAGKSPKKWLFQLLAGAYGCFVLGNLYLMLHTWIMQDWAFVFSPADVSWLGLYGFFIAIDTGLIGEWTEEEQQRAKKYRRLAWLGPAVVIAFHAAYIALYPEIWLNNLIFCVVLSFLGYYAFLMFFSSRSAGGIQHSLHHYHCAVLLFLLTELVLFLVSSFGNYPLILYYAILYLLTVWLCLMVPAAKKGVAHDLH